MTKIQEQIDFWAHMLDETKHQSYYEVHMVAHPEDKDINLVKSLIKEFANDLKKSHVNLLDVASKDDNADIDYQLIDQFADKIAEKYIWERIPAQQYAAIITRCTAMYNNAKGQKYLTELEYNEVRRNASRKVIENCLDIVCHNTNVLEANNYIVNSDRSDSGRAIASVVNDAFAKNGIPKIRHFDEWEDAYVEDYMPAIKLYSAWGSYGKGNAGEKYVCDSDNGPAQLKKVLNSCEYDADDMTLVTTLNRAIDIVHMRSDLANAFVEGGAKTCALVSNLPDKFVI